MKKITALLMASLLAISVAVPAQAATNDDKVINFEGEAEAFATVKDSDINFQDMEPGETRTVSLLLTNNDFNTLRFYMSGSVPENIANKGNSEAVYDVKLSKDGTVFFEGTVGSTTDGSINATNTNSVVQNLNDRFLLASLSQGTDTTVEMAVTLDGDSANNTYMSQEGAIQLNISVELDNAVPETVVEKQIITVTQPVSSTVKTGDTTVNPMVYIAIAGICAACVVIILVARKKREEDRNE